MTRLVARGAGRSEAGRVREVNEDRILIIDEAGRGAALYAVADGLGGHAGGEIASALAVDTLRRDVPALLDRQGTAEDVLLEVLQRANTAIRARATSAGLTGMATTCTAVLIRGDTGVVAHIGDSRAYLMRGNEIRQLTTDHSLAEELERHGARDALGAGLRIPRHLLTRALGSSEVTQVDIRAETLRPGDTLVLASDGLHTAVSAAELAGVVRTASSPSEACRGLVGLANARGGLDNISVVIVRCASRWIGRTRRLLSPLVVIALVAAGAGIRHLERAYFLGIQGDRVAVMRGVHVGVLGMAFADVVKITQVPVTRVAPAYRDRLSRGIPARSAEEAERLLPGLLSP
jgi:PPM family protein phosphatase